MAFDKELVSTIQCPKCCEKFEITSTFDMMDVIDPPIKAEFLKPSYFINVYEVTTKTLLEWFRLQVTNDVAGAEVFGMSLVLGDPKKYGSQGEFTELLVGITGVLGNENRLNWAEKQVEAATKDPKIVTPIDPLLKRYMFDNDYLQQYLRRGDYQKRNQLKRKLGISDEALHRLMSTSKPQIAPMIGDKGPMILVGLDVRKMMVQLFASKEKKVPVVDKDKNPVYNADGTPQYEVVRNSEGKPIDKKGNVITLDDTEKLQYVTVPECYGRIKLVGVSVINEYEVEYKVYYTFSDGELKDDRYIREYLLRRSRARK